MSKELWLKKPGGKMFKDLLLKDGINYISKDDLEKEAKSRNKISSREKLNLYRSKSDFAKTNLIQNGSSHKIYYSEMVLDDYLQWLDNNYGKKNVLAKQKSLDKLRVEVTASQQKTVSTKELENLLNTTHDVLLDIVRRVLPNKEIVNGIPTTFTEEEVTLILEYAKTHVGNNRSEEMKLAVANTETSLSSNLRVRAAIETAFRESDNLPPEEQGKFYDGVEMIMNNLIRKARQASEELAERNKKIEEQLLELQDKNEYIDELEETLKFHHISDWLPWGKWKIANGIKQNISAKIIFEEAKLIDGEGNDYLAVMFPNATKPSIYINPKTAVPKLMLWKKNNPTKINE